MQAIRGKAVYCITTLQGSDGELKIVALVDHGQYRIAVELHVWATSAGLSTSRFSNALHMAMDAQHKLHSVLHFLC